MFLEHSDGTPVKRIVEFIQSLLNPVMIDRVQAVKYSRKYL